MTISVNQTADLLGILRLLTYEQIQRGELPVIRIGRRPQRELLRGEQARVVSGSPPSRRP